MTTEIEKQPALPEGWAWTTLGEVCLNPQYGWTTSAVADGSLKLLRTTDITTGVIDWSSVPFCKDEPAEKDKYLLSSGDIVISRAGSVGHSTLITRPEPAIFASYLIRFKPLVDERFLAYFLKSPVYWQTVSKNSIGIAVPNVNATKLRLVPVPVAPLSEQRRIVQKIEELFTELDASVKELRKARTQLKRYRQSVLKAAITGELTREWREAHKHELEPASELLHRILREHREKWEQDQVSKMRAASKPPTNDDWKRKYRQPETPSVDGLPSINGWSWVPLDLVADAIDPQPSHRTPPILANGIPYIGMADVAKNGIDLQNARKVSPEVLKEHRDRYCLSEGDFFIGKIGTMGNPVKVISPFDYALSANVVLIQPKRSVTDERFCFYYMASPLIETLLTIGSRATTQAAFGIQKVRLLPFPLIPIAEQHQIKTEIERLFSIADSMGTTIERSLKQAHRMRQSILKAAFEGLLVAQDPGDEPAELLLERIRTERSKREAEKQDAPTLNRKRSKKNRRKRTERPAA